MLPLRQIFVSRSSCLHSSRSHLHAARLALAHIHTVDHEPGSVAKFDRDITLAQSSESSLDPAPDVLHSPTDETEKPKRKRQSKKTAPPTKVRVPLEPSKTEQYLLALQNQGLEPSLKDLERLRPAGHPRPGTNKYAEAYGALVDSMCRSFSSEQLRQFAVDFGLSGKYTHSRRRKVEYAEAIIEQIWQWPSLRELERKHRDKTVMTAQSFPLEQSHLFLIIGKDGSDLLQLSTQFNVHVSLVQNPLALKVEGVREALNGVRDHIQNIKKNVIEETFEVLTKTPIRHDLLQTISRLTGAFVENIGTNGQIRIRAKDVQGLNGAKRLAIRAATELLISNVLLSYSPVRDGDEIIVPTLSAPISYSLYPYLSPRSLPWMINTSGTFRWRRVGDWLGFDHSENLDMTGGMAGARGSFLTSQNRVVDLKEILLGGLPAEAVGKSQRLITAHPGHLLFTSSEVGQRATLIPPLPGSGPYERVLKWISDSSARASFIPSLPAHFLEALPAQQKIVHRLVYHALPSSIEAVERKGMKVVHFELTLSDPQLSSEGVDDGSAKDVLDSRAVICWRGLQTDVDVLMPDRHMDIRFSVTDAETLTSGEGPVELQTYLADLHAFLDSSDPDVLQPNPPLTLNYEGIDYILDTSASVRQSKEVVLSSPLDSTSKQIHALTESILDLESSQKSTVCLLSCDDMSEKSWTAFLSDCDVLTTQSNGKSFPR